MTTIAYRKSCVGIFLCFIFSFLTVSCSAEVSDVVGTTQSADIADWSVNSCVISYEGKALPIGEKVEEWEKVFGKHDRFVNLMYVFDRYGLKLYERDGVIVTAVLVYKNYDEYKQDYLDTVSDVDLLESYKKSNLARARIEYAGLVNVEGGLVKSDMDMNEFNRQRQTKNPNANLFAKAYLPTIYHLYRDCDPQESSLSSVGMRIEFEPGSTSKVQQFVFGGEVRESLEEAGKP